MCQNSPMVMLRRFLSRGHAEPFRGVVHALAGGLCGLMFAYNTAAWLLRRERHLATNALAYGFAVLYELSQTRRHLGTETACATVAAGRCDRVLPFPHRAA